MTPVLRSLNLLLMFLLELAVYASAGHWGYTVADSGAVRILLTVFAPAALAVVWALFGSPKAPHPARGGTRVLLEVLWFGTGVAALAAAGRAEWSAVFAGLFLANAALRAPWRE
ncbi:DUF2568 domain-containing protein [Streptomyces sp. RKND-216]|uniref:YrdB family protein n=1 Tax=Streptomyces sp. RKND-216 TaxID=2562581 RepID=UPI00109DF5C8|nr:YrdB family protein [Streptomyces sp. RKND-216]THA25850.1 DUF2568 domain-containing protein [Streptomyces sp. RKND-216]